MLPALRGPPPPVRFQPPPPAPVRWPWCAPRPCPPLPPHMPRLGGRARVAPRLAGPCRWGSPVAGPLPRSPRASPRAAVLGWARGPFPRPPLLGAPRAALRGLWPRCGPLVAVVWPCAVGGASGGWALGAPPAPLRWPAVGRPFVSPPPPRSRPLSGLHGAAKLGRAGTVYGVGWGTCLRSSDKVRGPLRRPHPPTRRRMWDG